MITRRQLSAIAVALLVSLLVVVSTPLVPVAVAGKGGVHSGGGGGKGGSGGGGTCTQSNPGITVQNTTGWSQWGSFGLPGQELAYLMTVVNYDVGCSSSSFVVSLAAPGGFSVSIPTDTISLSSGGTGYVWAYVTSPSNSADGDNLLTATVTRASAPGSSGSSVSYYKVYSSDDAAPTLFWENPGDGMTITGRSYNVSVSSIDDHMVQKIDLLIDGVFRSETVCSGISYTCSLYYSWSLSGVSGQHTATFESHDWMGNVGVATVTFTVN
jgi:hypothetical protein